MDSYWPFIVFIKESENGAQAKVLDEIFHQNLSNQMFYQLAKFHGWNSCGCYYKDVILYIKMRNPKHLENYKAF